MQAALATRHELEMLNCIDQPCLPNFCSCCNHGFTQEVTCRTYERSTFQILTITRLFSYNHELSVFRPLTPNSLGCSLS
ncbi:hypothetical protein DR92_4481 (plasmid) [Brucella anthropi]|nr:hypothetical protein DR92_4481 [Brucella anthropi]